MISIDIRKAINDVKQNFTNHLTILSDTEIYKFNKRYETWVLTLNNFYLYTIMTIITKQVSSQSMFDGVVIDYNIIIILYIIQFILFINFAVISFLLLKHFLLFLHMQCKVFVYFTWYEFFLFSLFYLMEKNQLPCHVIQNKILF